MASTFATSITSASTVTFFVFVFAPVDFVVFFLVDDCFFVAVDFLPVEDAVLFRFAVVVLFAIIYHPLLFIIPYILQ